MLVYASGVSSAGVGEDIIQYLEELSNFFTTKLIITSGYRSPARQAAAMFDNWLKLDRGKVYSRFSLSPQNRARLDELWNLVHAEPGSGDAGEMIEAERRRLAAKDEFMAIASTVPSLHGKGRAVDMSRIGIDSAILKAILLLMEEKKEGNRRDIHHFQADRTLRVDASVRADWKRLAEGKSALMMSLPPSLDAIESDPVCSCVQS